MNTKQISLVVIIVGLVYFKSAAEPAKKVVETDAHWTSGVAGLYLNGTNGEHIWNTNIDQFWRGVWKEGTNGWRVQLEFQDTRSSGNFFIEVGSVVTNSGGGYFTTPDGKLAKFELLDTNGTVIQPKWFKSLERDFPQKLSERAFAHWPDGEINSGDVPFVTNGPPSHLGKYNLNDIYVIKNEGDYTLTVCPVLYRYGTNIGYLDRVDLPCITTKIHLVPNVKN